MKCFQRWLTEFRMREFRGVPHPEHESEFKLSQEERETFGDSMAIFALGESSDGRNLLSRARAWGDSHAAPEVQEITPLFIKEENRHSQILKDIMSANEIPTIERSWSDAIFRLLRRLMGFWLATTVLVTAEIISLTFYRAMMSSTKNLWLKSMCEEIIEDERLHLRYEAFLVRQMELAVPQAARLVLRVAHVAFFLPVVFVVWIQHRRVFDAASQSILEVYSQALKDLDDFNQLIEEAGGTAESRTITA